jgi:hypothetical protein
MIMLRNLYTTLNPKKNNFSIFFKLDYNYYNNVKKT